MSTYPWETNIGLNYVPLNNTESFPERTPQWEFKIHMPGEEEKWENLERKEMAN